MIGYHARPGRQLLLFGWLVGLPAVMVETDLSSHHYDTAAFAASDLALSLLPLPQCISLGHIQRLVALGGIQS